MTKQEELQYLFDKSLNHIRQQGCPSVDEERGCVYRGPGGIGCAAAPFINKYHPAMDKGFYAPNEDIDTIWPAIADRFPTDVDPIALKYSSFVRELQLCHDDPAHNYRKGTTKELFMVLFEKNMKEVAKTYGLKYEKPA